MLCTPARAARSGSSAPPPCSAHSTAASWTVRAREPVRPTTARSSSVGTAASTAGLGKARSDSPSGISSVPSAAVLVPSAVSTAP